MSTITISLVTGIGGSPVPTFIHVEGEMEGCEEIEVLCSCSIAPALITGQVGALHPWSWDFPNDMGCACNDKDVKVTAFCRPGQGQPATATVTWTQSLPCPPQCPTATVTAGTPGPCDPSGRRSVSFTVVLAVPPGAPLAVAQLDFESNGASFGPAIVAAPGTTVTTPPPVQTHLYLAGQTHHAKLLVVSPAGCPSISIPVVVPACPPPICADTVTDIQFQVAPDCKPGGTRAVTATAKVSGGTVGDYTWQWDQGAVSDPPVTTAQGGATQVHDYPAPGNGPLSHVVHVTAEWTNGCKHTFSKPVPVDGCESCPAIQTVTFTVGDCTPDRLRRTVELDASVSGAVTSYVWDFGGGSTQTLPGSGSPKTSREFGPGTHTVTLNTAGPGNCSHSKPVTFSVDVCCPQVTDINATFGTCASGATSPPVTLTAQVTGTGFTSFNWDFGDGTPIANTLTPTAPVHSYATPGSFPVVVTAHAPGCPDVVLPKSVSVPACPKGGGGGGSPLCATLLWVAIGFMLVGAILTIAGCILTYFFVQVGLLLEATGLATFSTGAILFLIWWIFCRFFTACAVILAVREFVRILIGVFAFVAIVLWIVQIFIPVFQGCAVAATVYGAAWGAVLALISFIADARRCLIANPSGGPPPASPSGLSSSGGATRSPPSDSSRVAMTSHAPSGLGDLIKRATSALGIRPCGPCEERAARLNARFPLGVANRSEMARKR